MAQLALQYSALNHCAGFDYFDLVGSKQETKFNFGFSLLSFLQREEKGLVCSVF
jgi:hypothetical protein